MSIDEVDFRSTPLLTLCTSATNAVSELLSFREFGLFDNATALEYSEYFNGAVLVACQAYAAGVVSDVNRIRNLLGEPRLNKFELYRQGSLVVKGFTQVEFINALANFFKHRDEWELKSDPRTMKVLNAFDIFETMDFPLHSGIQKILGESTDLRGVFRVLEEWRFFQFEGLRGLGNV
jgi:hypothetical protein